MTPGSLVSVINPRQVRDYRARAHARTRRDRRAPSRCYRRRTPVRPPASSTWPQSAPASTTVILRDYYHALIDRGNPAKIALTAVMRKLIVLLNRLLAYPDFVLAD